MYKVALKECDETKIMGRFFSYTQLINFYKLKLHDMQGNKKFVKYQGYEWESNSEAESIKDVDNINMLLH